MKQNHSNMNLQIKKSNTTFHINVLMGKSEKTEHSENK